MDSLVKIYGVRVYNCRWYKKIFSQECIALEAHFRYIAMGEESVEVNWLLWFVVNYY